MSTEAEASQPLLTEQQFASNDRELHTGSETGDSVRASFSTVSNSYLLHPVTCSPVHSTLIQVANSGSYHERSTGLVDLVHSGVGSEWDEKSIREARKKFYFTVPWSPQVYFTVRGSENLHICLWIAKDLSWTQGWYYPALIFGISALLWCIVLCYHAFKSRCQHEMYLFVGMFLWLSGNFVWMCAEIISPEMGSRDIAGHIMEAAIGWLLFYHCFIKPCRLLPRDTMLDVKYEAAGLKSRFSYFENWRQYEHLHTLLWLGKDLSWILLDPYTWAICLVPTFLIGADFIITTAQHRNMFIDCMHYIAQILWVVANAVWALSELFSVPGFGDDDNPFEFFHFSKEAAERCRWWSSWMLVLAFVPIAVLYLVWLPLTCMGKIKTMELEEDAYI